MKNVMKKNGYSVIELLIVSSIMGVLTPFLINILVTIMNTTNYNIAINNQKKFDAVFVSKLGKVINSTVKFIGRAPTQIPPIVDITTPTNMSEFYLSIIKPPVYSSGINNYTPLNISSRILPILDSNGTFSPLNNVTDINMNAFNGENVGNTLIVVTIEDSFTYPYNNIGKYTSSLTPQFERRFPLYQIHYIYLAKANPNPLFFSNRSEKGGNLNKIPNSNLLLLEWKSNYMISYEDLTEFANTKLSGTSYVDILDFKNNIPSLKTDLGQNIPMDSVWNFSETNFAAPNKLIKLSSLATTGTAPSLTITGTEYSAIDNIPTNKVSNIAMYPQPDSITYGIEPNNFDLGNINANYNTKEANLRVPFFNQIPIANFNNATDGFPNGFEVMLSGTAGSTKAFFRMMSLATGKGVRSHNQTQVILQGKN